MAQQLNETQLQLFTKYLSITVQNNQEVHPSDMPPVVMMFKLLADKGYFVTDGQIDQICDSLHSLANREISTSDYLKEFLKDVASTFHYFVRQTEEGQRYKRSFTSIANDIISENNIEYSEP